MKLLWNSMMWRIQVVLFTLALGLVSGRGLMAQAGAPPARALTLEDALDYTLQHYPAVRASRATP